MDIGMIQQTAGIRREGRYGAPILRQRSTRHCGVGVSRMSQWVGGRARALPGAERGEL